MVPALGIQSVELAGAGSFPASGAGDGRCLLSLLSPIQITCPGAAGSKSWGVSCARAVPTTAPSSLSPCLSLQGTLEGLEEELLAFFSVTPHSVYTALMDNRYFPISGEVVSGVPCAPGLPQAAEGFWEHRRPLSQGLSFHLGTPTWPCPRAAPEGGMHLGIPV